MLKIPYGESNFTTLMEGHYFYQDRTLYFQTLENFSSKYLVYLRLRRFGKYLESYFSQPFALANFLLCSF